MGLGLRSKINTAKNEFLYYFRNFVGRPNLYDLKSPERIGAVYHYPSDMCETDKIMLYALVRGLSPKNALEIGARWGGSARIITNAMEGNGVGKLVGIDPEPGAFRVKAGELHGRYELVKGFSPEATPEAVSKLSGPIDFAFIDALHIYDAVLSDFGGIAPHLARGAHVLFHDAYHQGISAAVDDILETHTGFYDLGFITRNPQLGYPVSYQGLRLVRFGSINSKSEIGDAYASRGMKLPEFSCQHWNYDEFAIRAGLVKAPEASD